jgi:hypothetical protein
VAGGDDGHWFGEAPEESLQEASVNRSAVADRCAAGLAETRPIHPEDAVRAGEPLGETPQLLPRRDGARRREAHERRTATDLVIGHGPAPPAIQPREDLRHDPFL